MKCAVKIKLDLKPEDQAILDSQSRIANWLYNHLLEHANHLRAQYIETQDQTIAKTLYTKFGLRDLIPGLKQQFNFLKAVYSSPIKNTALRLTRSIQDYQKCKKGKSNKKKAHWPKFRSNKKKWFSLLYDEPYKGYKYDDGAIVLSLGVDCNGKRLKLKLELSEKLPLWFIPENVCQMRIAKQANNYYITFTLERIITEKKNVKRNIIAIDPNHKNLGYGVDTKKIATEIANPYFLKNIDKQIDSIKARRDRCQRKSKKIQTEHGGFYWKPSRRWSFFNNRLQKLYQKRREQIKTFLYTIANRLCKEYNVISIGDYTPNGGGITTKMRRAMNNQSVIGNFKKAVHWVAQKSSRFFSEWKEKGSTRTCYECGHIMKNGIEPNIREWTCPNCNYLHIRDENAAKNGLSRVLKELKLINRHCCVKKRRLWKFDGQGILETVK